VPSRADRPLVKSVSLGDAWSEHGTYSQCRHTVQPGIPTARLGHVRVSHSTMGARTRHTHHLNQDGSVSESSTIPHPLRLTSAFVPEILIPAYKHAR
jgi:hypothetical protein